MTQYRTYLDGSTSIGQETILGIQQNGPEFGIGISSNITAGIVTATGFISAANTAPISITLLGDQLTFTAVGIGSTTFTLT